MSEEEHRGTSVEARLAALEAAVFADRDAGADRAERHDSVDDRLWILEGLKSRHPEHSVVAYAGHVVPEDDRAPGPVEWQYGLDSGTILSPPWEDTATADALAALASPLRLRFVQEMLRGTDTPAALAELDGVGTVGQVYHHLQQLQAAGWVRQVARGRYGVPPERVVPLLTIVLASGGIA
ncbi:hypothetical protein GCM10009847_03000 [Leucobacter tardus]|uniref:Winged helix-turn-helix transcriptional regulator n=1 Tax=Leucobacter tardus TaxID=501483 RepID=A0A939QE44_9MICO|nr:winged helix-turn-helix domain-containing protein [Leucobacter tardus]MBO2988508.1 winged helix-turn-helix transcriptional regulator [Leucobacter tardus]